MTDYVFFSKKTPHFLGVGSLYVIKINIKPFYYL